MKFEEQKSCFKKKKKRIKEIILKTGPLYKSPFPDNIGLRIYKCWLNIYMYIYIYIYIYKVFRSVNTLFKIFRHVAFVS